MLRNLLPAVGLVTFGMGALAQSSAGFLPVPGVKEAGTYHLATGTWTRGARASARGIYDVIYDNTCAGSWYTGLDQQTFHDDGRLPSTTSPQIDQGAFGSGTWWATSLIGSRDEYEVNYFRIGYCSSVAAPMTAMVSFYECYTACSDATLLTPTAALQITGLPASSSPGLTVDCWVVGIDLLGSSLNFTMAADCDGQWDGSPFLDDFGYMYMQVEPSPVIPSGPILAGDPEGLLLDGPGFTGCCVGCGTVFWAGASVPGTSTEGSGLNTQDFFERDDYLGGGVFAFNGCYWFGGYSATSPHADIYMEIEGEALGGSPGTVHFCFGNTAQGNACFCGNDNDQSQPEAGCANGTFSAGASLTSSGTPSVSADTVILRGVRAQPNNSSMFFQGENNLDGAGVFLGDGIRCVGGSLKRLKVELNDASGSADTSGTVITVRSAQLGYSIQPGDTLYYQWWYRDTDDPPCGLGLHDSNTSNGCQITWQY